LYQYAIDLRIESQIVSMTSLEPMHQILICTSDGQILQLQIDLFHDLSIRNNNIENDFIIQNDDDFIYILYDLRIKIKTCLILQSRYEQK
jgi:hypothetical protein